MTRDGVRRLGSASAPWGTIKPLHPQEKDAYMKDENTIDKPAAGRTTQIAALVITGLLAFIWV
jgi:hypothetical protein